MQDITNQTNNADPDGKNKTPRPARERRERGPPADGIPSKTKVMVANLPYDLTEEKVGERSPHTVMDGVLLTLDVLLLLAQGALRRLPAFFRQDCPAPYPPLHDQEAPGPW